MRRHLRKNGLVTRRGDIVTENTYRLSMARKEHQKHVQDLMAQAIVHKALDMERHRQCEIKRKLEEISKVQLVRRVRVSLFIDVLLMVGLFCYDQGIQQQPSSKIILKPVLELEI